MRAFSTLLFLGAAAAPIAAQQELPRDLATVEQTRSRTCVGVLERVRVLDAELAPYAARSQRIQRIAEAVMIEDPSVVQSLATDNAFESDVAAWFTTDQLLAQRFVETGVEAIQEERANGRSTIMQRIGEEISVVQAGADSILAQNEETVLAAGPCDGAVFVRPAVVEACQGVDGPICDAAREPDAPPAGFFFVDDANSLWDMRELRPWTAPTGIQVSPTGQLDGARTVGYARVGNIVVTVALSPVLRPREEISPAERFQFDQTNQALGLIFDHPTIAFTPGFGMRAALPQALSGEDAYIIHFGDPTAPDVVWRGEAGTGTALEATIPMEAGHVLRLRNGDALALTALDGDDPRYTITLDTTGQAEAASALVTYMTAQLGTDLNQLLPPNGAPSG